MNSYIDLQISDTILQHSDYTQGPATESINDHALIELVEAPSGDNIATIFVDDAGGDSWVGVEDC